jgi:hypothetical protein
MAVPLVPRFNLQLRKWFITSFVLTVYKILVDKTESQLKQHNSHCEAQILPKFGITCALPAA